MERDYRTGDILRVSCPYTEARVTRVPTAHDPHVVVEWPWWSVDPDCDWVDWNGQVALVGDPASYEWDDELFRTEPAAQRLVVGATCRVGIPPTTVHVVSVEHYDPPLETGRLPRPRRHVAVLRAGRSYDAELDELDVEQGYEIDPDDDMPIALDLLFRPYAFLAGGDEVADAAGRAWRFDAPWDWHPFDGADAREPVWPLTLLYRGGPADEATAAAVARATRTGSHREELRRWTELARARPTRGKR
ncbi:hypothetical protein [Actinoallomurus rhizosphaericola]|uniref:hypothetical protein n=1 Tax=Actinoallomurus rhizosphaericola TaxID=2952536 RepID=UPI002093B3ED|nr:hypothetical protein [Actinoallomurus rhizosphaericola]MCO5996959.1 hypothetical protein [Actinoallomurus rhizosphaericola]